MSSASKTCSVATSGEEGVTIGHGGGVPFSQAKNGTNHWISARLPTSIKFALTSGGSASDSNIMAMATAAAIKQVHLVFDTGMHRHLSYGVGANNSPEGHWGPQPEAVRVPRLPHRGRGG